MPSPDLLVIGGGLIGLATAYQALRDRPGCRVVIFEKEAAVARHQSTRQAGVVDAGVHALPGSRKARHVRDGRVLLRAFCAREGLPWEARTHLVVALDDGELPRLQELQRRGQANGATCALIGRDRLRELEPHADGAAALELQDGAVVDFGLVAQRLAQRVAELGGEVLTGCEATWLTERPDGVLVRAAEQMWAAPRAVNAAGLHADRLAQQAGARLDLQMVPFRGQYYLLRPSAAHLCRGLIFPAADLALPFPGIHAVRAADGTVWLGPNAVWAGSREGYSRTTVSARDWWEQLRTPAVRRLTRRHLPTALWEFRRSHSRELFALTVQRLLPAVTAADLLPGPRGITAYALTPEGALVDDFVWCETARMVHVLSTPTAGATAALSIGRAVAQRVWTL